jgi:DNA polymerase
MLSQPVHPVTSLKQMPALASSSVDLPLDQRTAKLNALNEGGVKVCTKCRLHEARKNTVFGEGALNASLMFIGEGPGETEDDTGRPFVGRAGQLLTKMIQAMGLTREQVYIANVVKCRPPGNRTPTADEVATCTSYLLQQIEVIRPKVIVTLGLPATQYMLGVDRPMRELRGVWHDWNGIKIMPTYHPSYVLRSYTPEVRGTVWGDLQKVMKELGMPLKGQPMS